jgi:hypothetical protein
VFKLYTASSGTGMTYVLPFDAAQRALRAWAFATPSLQSQSPERSEDAASPCSVSTVWRTWWISEKPSARKLKSRGLPVLGAYLSSSK